LEARGSQEDNNSLPFSERFASAWRQLTTVLYCTKVGVRRVEFLSKMRKISGSASLLIKSFWAAARKRGLAEVSNQAEGEKGRGEIVYGN